MVFQGQDLSYKSCALTGIFEYSYHGPILKVRFPGVPRISNRGIESAYDNRILQRDGYTSQWSLEIDVFDPFFSARVDHDFGKAVGLRVGLDRELAIAPKNIDRFDGFLMDILDELLNGLVEYLSV